MQTITSDNKCQELWDLLQKARRGEMSSIHELVRYRREAERNSGSDEHLYKVEWVSIDRVPSWPLELLIEWMKCVGHAFANSADPVTG